MGTDMHVNRVPPDDVDGRDPGELVEGVESIEPAEGVEGVAASVSGFRLASPPLAEPRLGVPLLASPRPISDALLPFTASQVQRVLAAVSLVVVALALLDLALRAALRLETRWDTFAYHLPFAARLAGIRIPYTISDLLQPYYGAFPPLPHLVQGWLWRLTGSMNATGVANAIAFAGLLAYAHRCLKASFWLVAMIALTAPLVIIHAASSYVDLFGNSFLAAGACSCLYLFLFPEAARRRVFIGGLVALAAAAWSKFQLMPLVGLMLCLFAAIAVFQPQAARLRRRPALLALLGLGLLAAAPYLKNAVAYGNPFWPVKLPLVGDAFPYLFDPITTGVAGQRPPHLAALPQFQLFWHSLFEIDHPTHYPDRPRWIIDQGNARLAFRMGGFWSIAAAFHLAALVGSLIITCGRRGLYAALGVLGLLAGVACLPQSNELRYYLFIPLSGAVAIAMLMPRLAQRVPRLALALLSVSLGLFSYMVSENWVHYRVERFDQAAAAHLWGADTVWPRLERGKVYCAIDMLPAALLLTGPTLSEFIIVDRSRGRLCPRVSTPLRY